jgi:hypothetical protein
MSASVLLGISPADAEVPNASPLVEINGEVVTAEDLDRALGVKLTKLQEQIYTLKREQLEAVIAQRLLTQEAATRGISVPALLDAEVTTKAGLVTETEIERIYQANKANIPGEESEVRETSRVVPAAKAHRAA